MFASDPQDALVPIFSVASDSTQPVQFGSGIFVEFQAMPFIFTAAHVTDKLEIGELMVPTPDGIVPVDGYLGYIDVLPESSRLDDTVDVAYWRLSTPFARLLREYFRPLPQTRCRLITSSLELGLCSVYGYPVSRAEYIQGIHASETASYRGVAAGQEMYEKLGLSPDLSVVLHFHKKRAVSANLERMNPIHPRGVSGGGVFAWPDGNELSDDWSLPKLIGIFHTYKESDGLMIGSNLISIMGAIQLGQMKAFGGVE